MYVFSLVPTQTRRRAQGHAGFTLIEMIVVLIILGLTLTIVAGFLPRRNVTLELTSATSRVADAMRLARSRAIVESRPVSFAVMPGGHGFRTDDGPVLLGPSVSIGMTRSAILFTPDGSTSGGSVSVAVGNGARLIQVDWLTGRVVVTAPSSRAS
jgi:general secretion pathway protein H